MQTILILGAGLSSNSLIKYFLDHSAKQVEGTGGRYQTWNMPWKRSGTIPTERPFPLISIMQNNGQLEVEQAAIVISLLPARMHHLVAETCVEMGRNMVTASYLSPAIKALDSAARRKESF